MPNRPAVKPASLGIVAVVLAAVALGLLAILGIDRTGERGGGLSEAFDYQIEAYKAIDPALIRYEPTGEIQAGMSEARAVAVGPEDRVYVCGDRAIRVCEADGTPRKEIPLDGSPRCLAVVAGEGSGFRVQGSAVEEPSSEPDRQPPTLLYVGVDRRVEVLGEDGKPVARWDELDEKAVLTSIAVGEEHVFVADAGNRVVLKYDPAGQIVDRIGAIDSRRGSRGFAIPSPFFDVAVDRSGLLWVVNPGALRLECYSPDGDLERFWGKQSAAVEGFFGCCNPAHFALLPDGRFVTAEKGLLRVKVYDADGRFECVVAGPEQLEAPGRASEGALWDHEFKAVDVAADGQGRILVLNPARGVVQIFRPKQAETEAE